jgi:hypothetical protein
MLITTDVGQLFNELLPAPITSNIGFFDFCSVGTFNAAVAVLVTISMPISFSDFFSAPITGDM